MLKQFYSLRDEIFTFMYTKVKFVLELENEEWLCDLAFLVDLTFELNEVDEKLQVKGQFVHELYKHIKVIPQLQLWERQLQNGNTFHFPTLTQHGYMDFSSFSMELQSPNKEFSNRFHDSDFQDPYFSIVSPPFSSGC